nr:signal peptidase II [uncultured Sphingomonas sp.]
MANRNIAYLVALAIFALDQLTKWIVTGPLGINQLGDQLKLLPIFDLTYVQNKGISLGLLHADGATGRWLLVAMTAVIAIGVAYWISRESRRGDQLALALILGGAMGNIVDRVRFGYVTDFADLHFGTIRPFLVFNVADAAISIGVVILLIRAFVIKDKVPEGTNEHA